MKNNQSSLQVVLSDVRSLHNVGSVFRTADAAGVEKIYLSGITPTPLDRLGKVRSQVSKVALGAEATIPWEKVEDLSPFIKKMKKDGWLVWAVEQDKGSIPYYELKKSSRDKYLFIFGSETEGLPKKILKEVDGVLEIPMLGKKESLNVSVSVGIVLFQFLFSSRKK